MSSLLSLGIQAVRANQAGLAITGNNISNVNTPGYSRQVPSFQSVEGGGVKQESAQRITNQFINTLVWSDGSRFGASKAFERISNQVDNAIAAGPTSVSVKLDDYFKSLQAANESPNSLTTRELFVAESNAVVRRFQDLHNQVSAQKSNINIRMQELTEEINSQARVIANLNDRIRLANAAQSNPYELLDQRDQAISELSGLIDISVVEQTPAGKAIFIGNGEPLVIGSQANRMFAQVDKLTPDEFDVRLNIGSRSISMTSAISGGELGGLLEARSSMVNSTLDELGRLSLVFADTMNTQHRLGMDYQGRMGQNLFRDINDYSLMQSRVTSEFIPATVKITDVGKLQASGYELVFTANDSFRLTRQSDGKIWTENNFQNQVDLDSVSNENQMFFDPDNGNLRFQVDGFELNIDSLTSFATNERLVITPTRSAAEDIRLNITSGQQLALASPLVVDSVEGNIGTASASVQLIDAIPLTLSPLKAMDNLFADGQANRIELTKTPAGYELALFDSSNHPVTPNNLVVEEIDGRKVAIRNVDPNLRGEVLVEITGNPATNDKFNIEFNFDVVNESTGEIANPGISDNRNGLVMSDLTKRPTSLEGNYNDTYGRMVERVGMVTKIAQMDTAASQAVFESSKNQRDEISGVNLDEEAVKLIQFQQAYQAAAQLITASQRIFDALINAV